MTINEQEFIYGKLHYLTETVDALTNVVNIQQDTIGQLMKAIELMQSPEYAKKQSDVARSVDIANKIDLMRKMKSK